MNPAMPNIGNSYPLLRLLFWLVMLFLMFPHVECARAQESARHPTSVTIELTKAEQAWLAGNLSHQFTDDVVTIFFGVFLL